MSNVPLTKIFNKLTPILGNSLYQLLPGLVNQVLAFFVIKQSGATNWGQVVSLQLVYYIAAHIVSWGNKDYLLLQFSKHPAKINQYLQQSTITRALVLLAPTVLLVVFYYPFQTAIYLAGWIVLRFVSQSMEAIIIYEKNFSLALRSETAAFVLLLFGLTFWHHNLSFQEALLLVLLSHVGRVVWLMPSFISRLKGLSLKQFEFPHLWVSLPFLLMGLIALLQLKTDLYVMNELSTKSTTGSYQVLMSFVAMFLAVPGFIINPFIKNVYRLQANQLKSLQYKFVGLGLMISVLATPVLWVLMYYVYQLNFSVVTYLLIAVLMCLPFGYAFDIYKLYKANSQNKVLVINAVGISIVFLCCLLLIPLWPINGALMAQLLAQIFLVLLLKHHAAKLHS
jgi:O-antigen/teichoic acid export membrane protein